MKNRLAYSLGTRFIIAHSGVPGMEWGYRYHQPYGTAYPYSTGIYLGPPVNPRTRYSNLYEKFSNQTSNVNKSMGDAVRGIPNHKLQVPSALQKQEIPRMNTVLGSIRNSLEGLNQRKMPSIGNFDAKKKYVTKRRS